MDNIIEARELQIERKHFYVELRENERTLRSFRIVDRATPETTLALSFLVDLFQSPNMATRRKFAVRKSLRRRPKKSKLPATSRARVKKTKKPHYVYYFGDGHADGS